MAIWEKAAYLLWLQEFEAKGFGEESTQGGFFGCIVLAGVEDEGRVVTEFGEGLAAGSAGHGHGSVEVGDGNGAEADGGAVLGDGSRNGSLLGTRGEAIGTVFDVAAGDDGSAFEENGGTDAEVRVGGVGMLCGDGRQGEELRALLRGEG